MLKKLIKVGVIMSLMVTAMNASAQNTGKPEYPQYGFWSNWSIGFSFDLNNQAVMKPSRSSTTPSTGVSVLASPASGSPCRVGTATTMTVT